MGGVGQDKGVEGAGQDEGQQQGGGNEGRACPGGGLGLADLCGVLGVSCELSQLDLGAPVGTVPHKGNVASAPLLIDVALVVRLSILQPPKWCSVACLAALQHSAQWWLCPVPAVRAWGFSSQRRWCTAAMPPVHCPDSPAGMSLQCAIPVGLSFLLVCFSECCSKRNTMHSALSCTSRCG